MGTETLAISSVRMFRYAFGSLLLLAGTALLVAHGLAWLNLEPRILRALQGGAICAFGTALGAVPVLVIRRMPIALSDTLLGFGGGVMLAATAFSLVVPGITAAESLGLSPWGAGGADQLRHHAGGVRSVPCGPQGLRCQPGNAGGYAG